MYITFLSKENLLYNIIVTDKASEKGILKLLKINSPSIPEADRLILLFQDDSCLNNVICNTQFAYCIYPDMKILNKRKKNNCFIAFIMLYYKKNSYIYILLNQKAGILIFIKILLILFIHYFNSYSSI